MSEMSKQEAIAILETAREQYANNCIKEAFDMAIEALRDNKPSRTWIAKNEYRRGWHDAITRALSEVLKIHVGNEIFDMVQKETLIGLGLSMDSALGAEPYSETEVSYPEPDRPHGEWIEGVICYYCSECHNYALSDDDGEEVLSYFCPNCGSDNRKREGDEK